MPAGQTLHCAVSCGNCVWVSLQHSSLLHLLHVPSAEVIASVDCTKAVMNVLKGELVREEGEEERGGGGRQRRGRLNKCLVLTSE